jgi:ribonuclease HI
LADFIAEFTSKEDESIDKEEERVSRWTIHANGSSTKNAKGVGIIIRSLEGDIIKRAIRLQYATTNNEAEYEALLTGLKMAKTLGATELDVHSDSQFVVGQVNGEYEAKEERMLQYLNLVRLQMSRFHEVKLTRIPREQNAVADQLARSASSNEPNVELEVI